MGAFCLIIGGILGVIMMSLLSSSDDKTPSVESTKADVVYTDEIKKEMQKEIDFYQKSNPANDYERGCNAGAYAALTIMMEKVDDYSKNVYVITDVG